MNKTFVAILLSFLCAVHNADAKPVKEEKVKQFAKNWALEKWGKKVDKVSTKKKATVQLAGTATNLYYILSFPQGGWMIISGDDVAYPVIAFSPTGIYSEQHRPITHREAARFQSFPDSFRFTGSKIEIAQQIGNAVPPLLAARVADIVRILLGSRTT